MTDGERKGRIGELLRMRALVADLLETIDGRLQALSYEPPAHDTAEVEKICHLSRLLARCEEDTARLIGKREANRLAKWRRYQDNQAKLVEFIRRMLRGPGRLNGWKLDQKGGLSLERIVIEYCPELFAEEDILQAKDTLQLRD